MKQRDGDMPQAAWCSQPRSVNEPALLTADVNLGKEMWIQNSAFFAHLPM